MRRDHVVPPRAGHAPPSHCGFTHSRLRLHLGLVTPAGARMRVADRFVEWQQGKCVVFDDSFEHEVWHSGSAPRIVLLIDIPHPDAAAPSVKAHRLQLDVEVRNFMRQRGLSRIERARDTGDLSIELDEYHARLVKRLMAEMNVDSVVLETRRTDAVTEVGRWSNAVLDRHFAGAPDRGTLRGMPDSYNGFAFLIPPQRVAARGINVAARRSNAAGRGIHVAGRPVGVRGGGRPQRRLLVIAKDVHRATEIARSMMLPAIFADAGPDVLARACKLGIRDDDAGIDEGQAS